MMVPFDKKIAINLRLFTHADGSIEIEDDVLKKMLERALECEDYESAEKIRKEFDRRGTKP